MNYQLLNYQQIWTLYYPTNNKSNTKKKNKKEYIKFILDSNIQPNGIKEALNEQTCISNINL